MIDFTMNVADSLSVLGLGDRTSLQLAEIKKAYRLACKKYHPDVNPDTSGEMMKMVNLAYKSLKKMLEQHEFILNKNHDSNQSDFGSMINDILSKIINLEGLEIEVCGSWVWVGGDSKAHKTILKELGFRWNPKKLKWSKSPDNKRIYRGKKQWSMDEVRANYGSVKPSPAKSNSFQALPA